MKQRSGRVIGMFGLPCSGKTTLAQTIVGSSKEIIAHISTGDIARRISTESDTEHMAEGNLFPDEDRIRTEIKSMIKKRRSQGAEVILLDGCPRFDDQVKWMLEEQWVGSPDDGMLVQIRGDELIKRAYLRDRDNQDNKEILEKKIKKHQRMIDDMERIIFYYGIPYYTVNNSDLFQASKNLSKLIGLRK